MKRELILLGFTFIFTLAILGTAFATDSSNSTNSSQIDSKISTVQVPFIENQGQIQNSSVKFEATTFAGKAYVTEDGITYVLVCDDKGWVIRESFLGANGNIKRTKQSETQVNYFIGSDPEKWKTNIPTYDEITYQELYPNIDLTLKAYGKNLEKFFVINPGGNPKDIAIKFEGSEGLWINENGELEIATGIGTVKMSPPVAFQEFDDGKHFVDVAYKNIEENIYGFEILGSYDKTRALIIDPTLVYSTFLGGSNWDGGYGIAVDSSGNAYVTGFTYSTDFPTTEGAYDRSHNGGGDVFVAKINPAGNDLIYSTFLGGSGDDEGYEIAVDSSGNAYVTGATLSSNFPAKEAFDPDYNGNWDAFVAKINPAGNDLIYSTFLGGSNGDSGIGIAVDSSGNVYVTGVTSSGNFPTIEGAFDRSHNGGGDAFVSKLSASADLSVTKTDDPDPVIVGNLLTYTIKVTNNGPSDAQNVIIQDTVPTQLWDAQYSTDNGLTWNSWTGSLNLSSIAVGSSKTVLIRGRVFSQPSGGVMTNTASVTSSTTDPNAGNNVENEDTTVQRPGGGGGILIPIYQRIAGIGRIETACKIAEKWGQSNTIILTRSDLFPDALAGGPLSEFYCPIMLTQPTQLTESVLQVLQKLQTRKIIILGGTPAVSEGIEAALKQRGYTIERIAGATRYETSAEIAKKLKDFGVSKILIATGENFPDALAAAPYAAKQNAAIILTDPNNLRDVTRDAINFLGVKDVTILGGSVAVSQNIEDQLKAMGLSVERIAGADRYETAVKIAEKMSSTKLIIATGENFPDALAGGALAIKENAIILLVKKEQVPHCVRDYLVKNKGKFTQVWILGGEPAVSSQVEAEIGSILG